MEKPHKNKAMLAWAFLAAMMTFVAYLPSLESGFVNWDDPMYVYDNPYIRSLDLNLLKNVFTGAIAANWHPVTILSLAPDYSILGFNPGIYHLTNIVLHALNVFLVFMLACRIIEYGTRPKGPGLIAAGLVTALLFGLHPLHVESVAWISGRKDVLSTFFFLLSILAYIKYAGSSSKKSYLASLGFFILAVMSKPMAITLPLVLLILDFHPLQRATDTRAFMRAVYEKIPFFAFSVLSGFLTLWAQGSAGALEAFDFHPVHIRAANAVRAAVFYLYKTILPFDLAQFYPLPEKISLLSPEYAASFILFLTMTFFCILALKRQRVFFAVMLYYIVTLLPVSGIIQAGSQAAADRYTYIPLLGPFLLVGAGAGLLSEAGRAKRAAAVAASAVLLAFFAFLTVRQEAVWKDSLTLWAHEIEIYQKVPVAYYNRGLVYQGRGDTDKALKDYGTAISLNPGYIPPYINRGLVYGEIGKSELALEDFNKAILIDPGYGKAYLNRGYLFLKTGDYRGAVKDLERAGCLGSESGFSDYNLGVAYTKLGEEALAGRYFKKAALLGFKGEDLSR